MKNIWAVWCNQIDENYICALFDTELQANDCREYLEGITKSKFKKYWVEQEKIYSHLDEYKIDCNQNSY